MANGLRVKPLCWRNFRSPVADLDPPRAGHVFVTRRGNQRQLSKRMVPTDPTLPKWASDSCRTRWTVCAARVPSLPQQPDSRAAHLRSCAATILVAVPRTFCLCPNGSNRTKPCGIRARVTTGNRLELIGRRTSIKYCLRMSQNWPAALGAAPPPVLRITFSLGCWPNALITRARRRQPRQNCRHSLPNPYIPIGHGANLGAAIPSGRQSRLSFPLDLIQELLDLARFSSNCFASNR